MWGRTSLRRSCRLPRERGTLRAGADGKSTPLAQMGFRVLAYCSQTGSPNLQVVEGTVLIIQSDSLERSLRRFAYRPNLLETTGQTGLAWNAGAGCGGSSPLGETPHQQRRPVRKLGLRPLTVPDRRTAASRQILMSGVATLVTHHSQPVHAIEDWTQSAGSGCG